MSSLIVASLICLAHAQVYVTEGVPFNPTAAASAAPSATSLVIDMPLVPLNPLSTSQDLGANQPYFTAWICKHSWGDILEYTGAEIAEPNAAYLVIPNHGGTLALGANSVLNISHAIDALPDNQTLTVPFDLNLGYEGKCNGSLVFGGKAGYDANRVQSGQWYTLPGSEYGTFLKGGTVNLAYNATVQKFAAGSDSTPDGKSRSYHTRLNFNSKEVVLPSGFGACGSNFSVTLSARSAGNKKLADLTVVSPASASGNDSRCANAASIESPVLELGLPFFSLAYIMVPTLNSPLYVTLPNTYDLPPSPVVFSANQTLVAPSPPASTPTAAATSSAAGHVRITTGLLQAMGASVLAFLL